MAKTNIKYPHSMVKTHEGAPVRKAPNAITELRRTMSACLLWEDSFYESGVDVAKRISDLVPKCDPIDVARLAVDARQELKLRHAPLFVMRELARIPAARPFVEAFLPNVIQRADELGEFLALYFKDNPNQPLASCVKKGLAAAFHNFDEYQFAKYNREGAFKLRDVMFLCHPKPKDEAQALLFKRIADDKLKSPETWENRLSRGENKKATFEDMIEKKELGGMALLRNLRGMTEANVNRTMIAQAIVAMNAERILPFRFIAAAKHAPQFEPQLESSMLKCLEGANKLAGRTLLLVDVSGSMTSPISAKSDMNRIEAACGLSILLREVCEDVDVYTFAAQEKLVPARRGFALRDAIMAQFGGSTKLGYSLGRLGYGKDYERVIVITDGQSEDAVGRPLSPRGYILNVASYQNGVGYGPWTTIDGWSESCVRYISELETVDA